MKPDIFMHDFERTDWADAHYSVIGRALTFASRFEGLCKALNVLIGIKENRGILDSEEEVANFVNNLHKQRLIQHVTSIARDDSELQMILNKGRLARNEIAHEIASGLDRCIDLLEKKYIEDLIKRLRALIIDLAEADRVVSFIISVVTNEPLPTRDFLTEYPHYVEQWVMERDK
ncbi:MAG: hypothetical protein FIA94_04710 [Nitrospirae bacterium]|nr:hypothetical protein [Nitrospirota bacterium]